MIEQAHRECYWRADVIAILYGTLSAYTAGAHPRDALIVEAYTRALAQAFGVQAEPTQARGVVIELPRRAGG